LIHPVLKALGWDHMLPQHRASLKGRFDIPDVLPFADADSKATRG
jgi:hypothetical protein